MTFPEKRLRLWADFNETYESDFIWTSLRRTSVERPDPGDWVTLYGDDDEECHAIVVRVDGPIVHCKIDWSTWSRVEFNAVVPFPNRVPAMPTFSSRAEGDTEMDEERFKPTPIAL